MNSMAPRAAPTNAAPPPTALTIRRSCCARCSTNATLLGQARSSSIATIGNPAESKLQWQLIDVLRIVSVEPLHNLGMLGILEVSHGIEGGVEAGNAAAVFRRTGPFASDLARVGNVRIALTNVGHRKTVFPGASEVEKIVDNRRVRLQHVAQSDLGLHLLARRRPKPLASADRNSVHQS
jgi:hypothetical protein